MNNAVKSYKLLIAGMVFMLMSVMAKGQYTEYEVKAAYIFNFAKFIDWEQPQNKDTLILGIYKNDPFGMIIDKTMQGRKANNKAWRIKRINHPDQAFDCDILFFSDVSRYETFNILEKLKGKPILTIGDEMEDFCENGGVINFTPQLSEHQFEINNEMAKTCGINISPKLLVLAKIISSNEDEF